MSQGININFASEAMSLEPSSIVEFYKIYYAYPDNEEDFISVTPFRRGGDQDSLIIFWQGHGYLAYPMEATGFSTKGDNTLARPRLKIANRDLAISKYLSVHNNLVGAKVVRKRTFAKFLDGSNFQGGENPYFNTATNEPASDPTAYLPDQTFYINRRITENKMVVELELSTPLELSNVYVPNRNVYSNVCSWLYRGYGCRYNLKPKTTALSKPFLDSEGTTVTAESLKGLWQKGRIYYKGDYVYTESSTYLLRSDFEPDLTAPSPYLRTFYVCVEDGAEGNKDHPPLSPKWQKDECGKKISDCKLRFGGVLPFGGYPGTHAYRPKG